MASTAQADADMIVKLLLDSELPVATRQMFVDGMPHAIFAQSGVRHEFQKQFVSLARATLLDLQHTLGERQAAVEAAIEAAKTHCQEGKTALEVATQAEEAASAVVQEKAEELRKRRDAAAKTRLERTEAELVKDRLDKVWSQLESQKSTVSFLLEGHFRMLQDGGWGDEEARDTAVDEVQKYLQSLRAEPALLAASPTALACRPESRTSFDTLTTSCVEEVLRERAASLDQQLQEGQSQRQDATAEALGLAALLEREGEEEVTAHAALMEAKAALQDAVLVRTTATEEVARRGKAVSDQLSSQVLQEEQAKRVATTLEAAERLVAFEYEAVHQEPICLADTKASSMEDVEMVDAASKGEDALFDLCNLSAVPHTTSRGTY